jgi:FlaA1/EpsC-like NDP-sugar epimerase
MNRQTATGETQSPQLLSPRYLPTQRIQILLDLLVFIGAFVLSYLLRFEFNVPAREMQNELSQILYVVFIQIVALIAVGSYKFIWRYIGMTELKVFGEAALIAVVPLILLRSVLPQSLQFLGVPTSIVIMDTCFAFGGALLLRVVWRALYERNGWKKTRRKESKRPILLIGAGQAGMLVVRELRAQADTDLEIEGFIDDEPRKQGTRIHGIDVLGTTKDIPRLVRELKIDHVVITIAKGAREEIRRIIKTCEQVPVHVRIMPALYEIIQGKADVSNFREIQIEDLLGRDSVQLDEGVIGHFLTGKRIMVTGAGGSIGAELVRQIARYHPARLLLVERAEFSLFSIHREMEGHNGHFPSAVVPLLADINDHQRMRAIFEDYRPQVVLHAAAHKHVPMLEANPTEAIRNNVLATNQIGELAGECGVEAFVLISTDKAVNPISVMGASKRVAELVVQNLNQRFEKTRYLAVRFGNVIGSAGSVIPIFQEQIRKGGPVTVTDKKMERYFMTIPEAAQLVLQAGSMGRGGEIFILRMGLPVRIYDLARDMIIRSGLRPDDDIEIKLTGVRPGEKLFEELESSTERYDQTRHPKILIGKIPAYPREKVSDALERLDGLVDQGNSLEIRRFLNALIFEAKLETVSVQESFYS